MSTTTTRNSLTKPAYSDAADIAIINANMDTIDASFAKCNWAAATDPGVGDDTADGYSIGSIWFNTTGHKAYIAEAVTAGAAVWRKIYPSDAMVVTNADPTVNDDSGDGYAAGQLWFNYATNYLFMAKSVSVGAAIWMRLSSRNSLGTTAPTVNADTLNGYAAGSMWTDTTNKKRYVCLDATTGAAVWKETPVADTAFDIGAVEIRALTFQSDQTTGTAPFTVASTTKVTNLNADQLDGLDDTAFVKQTLADAKGDMIVASAADTWAKQAIGATDGMVLTVDSSAANGVAWLTDPITTGQTRNFLINPEFLVSNHGVAQVTSATVPANLDDNYITDQWMLLSDGNDIMDVWRSTTVFPTGTGIGASLLLQTETANKKAGIIQFLENQISRAFVGGTVSLSFYAMTTAANPNANIMAGVLSWSSTADTITSDVVSAWEATNTAPTLIANWTYENVPTRLALVQDVWTRYTIENIAIDTANTTNVAVFIWLDDTDSTVDDRLYITGVQLNLGATAAPYASLSIAQERIKCARYFKVLNAAGTAYAHYGAAVAYDTQYAYEHQWQITNWFKSAATPTLLGACDFVPGSISCETLTGECLPESTTLKWGDSGKGLTANHCYVMMENASGAGRVFVESRL